jgi:hypothetical protein
MWDVMNACVIMHNESVDEEHDDSVYDQGWDFEGDLVAPNPGPTSFQDFHHAYHDIRDRATHHALLEELVNHIWIHVENNPVTNHGNYPI